MTGNNSLYMNLYCVVGVLLILVLSHAANDQSLAFAVAALIAIGGALVSAWRATGGSEAQIAAGPVMAIMLFAILRNFDVTYAGAAAFFSVIPMAVTFGTSILALLNSGRNRVLLVLLGTIVGWAGLTLSISAVILHLPGSGLFIPVDNFQTINPFHLDFFGKEESLAEMQERIRHNGVPEHGSSWGLALFALQTIAVSAWDALLLSAGVWVTGAIATMFLNLFGRARA